MNKKMSLFLVLRHVTLWVHVKYAKYLCILQHHPDRIPATETTHTAAGEDCTHQPTGERGKDGHMNSILYHCFHYKWSQIKEKGCISKELHSVTYQEKLGSLTVSYQALN
jgi:hypothetical protein